MKSSKVYFLIAGFLITLTVIRLWSNMDSNKVVEKSKFYNELSKYSIADNKNISSQNLIMDDTDELVDYVPLEEGIDIEIISKDVPHNSSNPDDNDEILLVNDENPENKVPDSPIDLQHEEENREALHGAENPSDIIITSAGVGDIQEIVEQDTDANNVIMTPSFDKKLGESLLEFFLREESTSIGGSILSLGSTSAHYSTLFRSSGFFSSCLDVDPKIQELSSGRCGPIDWNKPLDFPQYEWIIALDLIVQDEDTFLKNLDSLSSKGVIISWPKEGRELLTKLNALGFKGDGDENAQDILRNEAENPMHRNTIHIFRKLN